MNYTEFLANIYQRYSGNVKLGLERIKGILEDMNNPQSYLHGMHIGGTNGKGSVSAACEALCLAHGFSTGLNTSPHLIDYTERFRIDGKEVGFEEVLEVFRNNEATFAKWEASFFEITTAIAFQLFAAHQVKASIIEVGLGGRLDATNLFIPDAAAITTIGLDHVKTLGGTLELIAYEKAGIIKRGIPTVLGRIEPGPLNIIAQLSAARQAPLYLPDRDYQVDNIVNSPEGVRFDYRFGDYEYVGLQANLLGRHQADNLGVALTTFLLYCTKQGLPVAEINVRNALRNIRWMGRMQVLQTKPLLIVDGAHNLQGVQTLTANLAELFPGRKFRLVVSILADKDFEQMLRLLCPLAIKFYISQNTSERAAGIAEQASIVQSEGIPHVTAQTVKEALHMALDDAAPEDILIGAGSLYTVAEIITALRH